MAEQGREGHDTEWIDRLTDEQCAEIFWLYVDPPEPFLRRFPPALLGHALRYALRTIARDSTLNGPSRI